MPNNKPNILVANMQAEGRALLGRDLAGQGYSVRTTDDLSKVLSWAGKSRFDLVLLDIELFDARQNGFDVLRQLVRQHPDLPVIAMGAENTVLSSLLAARFGAVDYFAKPYSFSSLASVIRSSLGKVAEKNRQIDGAAPNFPVIGDTKPMRQAYQLAAKAIKKRYSVSISGPAGSGKMTLALMIAEAISDSMENIPVFQGSMSDKSIRNLFARVEKATAPTFILQRLDTFSFEHQRMLVDWLFNMEQMKIRPLTIVTILNNVSINTTNSEVLPELLQSLPGLPITLPAMAERREDTLELAQYFLYSTALGNMTFSKEAEDWLAMAQRFESIREIKAAVCIAIMHCETATISKLDLQSTIIKQNDPGLSSVPALVMTEELRQLAVQLQKANPAALSRRYLSVLERPLLDLAMQQAKGSQVKAAQILGINRNTLRKKLSTKNDGFEQ